MSRCPAVKKVVLWGLCDGASAALIYVQRSRDARVAGVCILNPWVRTASSLARTHIKHYYGQRLMDRQFWTKLMTGGVKITGAFRELISKFRVSTTRSGAKSVAIPYQSRMALAISESRVSVLLLTSGRDFTAKEFLDFVATDSTWAGVFATARLQRVDIAEADHTFSTAFFRGLVEDATIAWIRNLLA